ncbi:MAG TPA: O-antigen ligase family protein [Opitutaceae bacterium]
MTKLAGRLLQLTLLFAPLAYACTRAWAWDTLVVLLHLVSGIWILGYWHDGRRPRVARLILLSAPILWGYVWIRGFAFAPLLPDAFTIAHFGAIQGRWPESVIVRTPHGVTELVSGLLAVFFVVADLGAIVRWRRRFISAMVLAATLTVLLGFAQNATHAPGIYWQDPVRSMPSQFFGPFFHFTSAGAFINLTWPIALMMAVYSWHRYRDRSGSAARALTWSLAAFLILLAHTAHISRFTPLLAVGALCVIVVVARPWKILGRSAKAWGFAAIAGLILAISAVFVVHRAGHLRWMASRWSSLEIRPARATAAPLPPRADWPKLMRDDLIVPYSDDNYFLRDRGASYFFAWQCIERKPLFGFGPGQWMAAISRYATDPTIGTFYLYLQFVHDDYLQTLVEWGVLGTALAALIVLASLKNGIKTVFPYGKRGIYLDETQAVTFGALLALFTVLIQSLVDFPLQIPANALYACMLLALCSSSFLSNAEPVSSFSERHGQ